MINGQGDESFRAVLSKIEKGLEERCDKRLEDKLIFRLFDAFRESC